MTDDFAPIERLAGDLLLRLAPAEKRSLLRKMARAIRDRQSQRIARQQNPDGMIDTDPALAAIARIRQQQMGPKGSFMPEQDASSPDATLLAQVQISPQERWLP